MYSTFDNISIAGIATTLPENEIDNMSFAERYGEDVVKKQIKVTGIKKRRVVKDGQTTFDLVVHSARKVLEHTKWNPEDVDVLIFASGYTLYATPATSYRIHKELGIKSDCIVLDINLACTGTVDGLFTICSLMQQCRPGAKGLLLVGETTTVGGLGAEQSTSMLSSDCGAAIALEKKENSGHLLFGQKTDGSRYEVLVRKDIEDHIHMDGMAVFEFAINDVVDTIKDYFNYYKIQRKAIDYYVIHQAQKFIVDKVARFAEMPKDRIINSYQYYGNSGGASDICTLCANAKVIRQSHSDDGIRCFMTGFGAGLSWGMVTLDIPVNNILDVCYSNRHYLEA